MEWKHLYSTLNWDITPNIVEGLDVVFVTKNSKKRKLRRRFQITKVIHKEQFIIHVKESYWTFASGTKQVTTIKDVYECIKADCKWKVKNFDCLVRHIRSDCVFKKKRIGNNQRVPLLENRFYNGETPSKEFNSVGKGSAYRFCAKGEIHHTRKLLNNRT